MSTLSNSPLFKSKQPKAPLPSPALLALQQKGLELSQSGKDSVSPPCVHELLDQNQRVSPFSLASTSSDQNQPLVVDMQVQNSRRSSSAESASTTVTKILNLYINVSDWSLQSEYEEITPYPDDTDEDAGPAIPTVHQPKAYRDTIASLLEHQFSNYNLTVPAVDSPQSFISLPKLLHPNANLSLASLHLEPDALSNTERKVSDTSIQITPDISPPLPSTNYASAPPSFQKYSQDLAQRKIALEVPDVRMTGPWYDQPVSPAPSITQADNRKSYESATTVVSIDYERQMAYDALAPPITRKSPQMGPVSVVHDEASLHPSSAVVRDIVKQKTIPLPLDLSRTRSLSSANVERLAAQQAQKEFQREQETGRKVQKAENVKRPSSTLSSESNDSFVIHDTFRGHLKALWRHKFNKSEKVTRHTDPVHKGLAALNDASTSSPQFVNDVDSYRYPYKLPDGSDLLRSESITRKHDRDGMSGKVTGFLDENQRATAVSRDPRRFSPQQAIPLTSYQRHGPEIWYESKKEKHREEREAARKAAAVEAFAQVKSDAALDRDENKNECTRGSIQNRPSSSLTTSPKSSTDHKNDGAAGAKKMVRISRASQNYNDSIFEASGGRKKSGFASRLLMSSEEKRKLKVKESILVVGSARMSSRKTDRGSSSSVKPLVRL